jgi:hypothetical protein
VALYAASSEAKTGEDEIIMNTPPRETPARRRSVRRALLAPACLLLLGLAYGLRAQNAVPSAETAWPPPLQSAVHGVATIKSDAFLTVPPEVEKARAQEGAAPFVVARTPPVVELVYHGELPGHAQNATGWTAWGDILVAGDGRVYCGLGNHGNNALRPEGENGGQAFLYQWNPPTKTLRRVVDLNHIVETQEGDPSWTKVHAGILEGRDGKIYLTGTLNDGGRAYQMKWTPRVPGGQLFEFDPATEKTRVVASFPGEVTPTTELDRARNIWYGNLEGKTGHDSIALTAVDLGSGRVIYQSPHDAVHADRNLALARDGAVYFNGLNGLWKYDPATKSIAATRSAFPAGTMRSSTAESRQGFIYGTTMNPGRLFRYAPAQDKLEMLGPEFLTGDYTAVTVLSPDEKFVYYLPGSHGGAAKIGTPVVQYEIATGQRKVLAFLRDPIAIQTGYVPAGTYGVAISADGATLYVNFNGTPANAALMPWKHAKNFGLTAFAAIHIPASER